MTLAQARASIGRAVIYRAPSGRAVPGTITATTKTWVVVRYQDCNIGKATAPELLELSSSTHSGQRPAASPRATPRKAA